jgi:beta-galactosidase
MYRLNRSVLIIAVLLCVSRPSCVLAQSASPASPPGQRERLSLDRGWLFHLGDIPFPTIRGQGPSYENAKAGHAWGAAAAEFDDSDWRTLDLPHDWAVEGPFDQNENPTQGYRPRGIGWYRRHFKLDTSSQGEYLELQFEGVATHCVVWVNGILAHRNWCGYNSFVIDITPFAKYGDDVNTIAVRVDANAMEGWWYEGAGIYRHTWLAKRDSVHIATDGVYANPVRNDDHTWTIPIDATLYSCRADSVEVNVVSTLLDPSGNEAAWSRTTTTVGPLDESVAHLDMCLAAPQLWSVEKPVLYELRTAIICNGKEVDQIATHCGFRTIRFDPNLGFFLNDQPLKLKGVCNHQDHAGVGVAVPDSLWDFRIRRLREMGANAYRSAHHPPSAEFLDACDRIGMLVMDENRNFNTTPEYLQYLEWLVRRDRNHPSVILWSVFNEEPMQGTVQGYEMVRRMAQAVKRLDMTRPVTAAQSNSMLNPVNASQAADVAGFNYQHGEYDLYHAANPDKPIVSSEDTSAVMTRGEFKTDRNRSVLNSYDTEFQPWGTTHRNSWKAIAERPFVAGSFVWTGFDYHGEPQPLEWPATGSSFGCLDLCGFPKTAYFIRQAQWIDDRPILQLVPHWNWPGEEGQPVKVLALTNAESVALVLNGKPIGEKKVDKYEMVSWEVPYEPGRLEAIAKEGGDEVSRFVVETTGAPVALQICSDRSSIAGDGCDALPITIRAVDAEGRPVPTANLPVRFELEGPGKIIGLGNGDPTCHEPEKGNCRSLFNGLAQVIVQSDRQSAGKLKLRAIAEGIDTGEVVLDVTPTAAKPEVLPITPTFIVSNWRMSPLMDRPPSPDWRDPREDMRLGRSIEPGQLQEFSDGRYAVYRTQFTPRASVRNEGGELVLRDLVGKAQIWVDGKLAGVKTELVRQTLTVPLSPGSHDRAVNVVIEASPGSRAGLGGPVTVE